jgi:hypothetical protein
LCRGRSRLKRYPQAAQDRVAGWLGEDRDAGGPLSVCLLCESGKIAQATEEHCRHPGNEQSTDLEAGKAVYAAHAGDNCNGADSHAAGPAKPADPKK